MVCRRLECLTGRVRNGVGGCPFACTAWTFGIGREASRELLSELDMLEAVAVVGAVRLPLASLLVLLLLPPLLSMLMAMLLGVGLVLG